MKHKKDLDEDTTRDCKKNGDCIDKDENEKTCECDENCSCGNDCHCDENCTCGEDCHCNDDCTCGEDCECTHDSKYSENCTCGDDKFDAKANNYLNDLLRLQAEFDNYRKRMQTALGDARTDGFIDAIEGFLPALDSFKMATDMITDQNTLVGIKFIEKGILDTLSKIGVEEIDTTGKFNPDYHQAIYLDENAAGESGDIVNVASKGFTYKGKVIRYAQVIVKK